MAQFMDLTGQRYGRLIVLTKATPIVWGGQQKTTWLCRCDEVST
jgi:hypothetical protein